jgi:hypothetical protein
VLAIFPGDLVLLVDGFGRFSKGRDHDRFLVPLRHDIHASLHVLANGARSITRFGQRKVGQRAQSDVPAFSICLNADDPTAFAVSGKFEDQALTIRISPRFLEISDSDSCQLAHCHALQTHT